MLVAILGCELAKVGSKVSEMTKPDRRAGARRRWRSVRAPAWFVLPALVIYGFVVLWSAGRGAVYAFTDWDGLSSHFNWVGWENFTDVFSADVGVAALRNTLIFAAVIMVFQNLFGLLLALALNSKVKSRGALRTIFFAPVILTPLVTGYTWDFLLQPDGTVNTILRTIGLGDLAQNWLGDPRFAMGAVIVAYLWQFSGMSMVIYLAGLQAVPPELLEAAAIDGASPVRRFFSVTLPLINGSVVINGLLTMVNGLGQFDQVYAMTKGGPLNATQTISTVIYHEGFQLGNIPFSSALALVMALIVGVLAITQYRLSSRQVER